MIKFSCPCHFGLESTLKFEIKKIGGENIQSYNGRVTFEGDYNILARANICLASAERVLIELAEFHAETFEELFCGVKNIALEEYIGKWDAFPVKGYSLNSKLKSVPTCQSIIKKACVERLRSKYGVSYFEESGAVHQIQFSIMNDNAVIYLDTSGAGLHKRGYRKNANAAPIKETLAAGIVDVAFVKSDSVVYDPFCGSGTILIEAAFKALNIAPGLNRHFAAEKWKCIDRNIWSDERSRAIDLINKDASFEAYGTDIDDEAVELTIENAKKAGVKNHIRVKQADVRDYELPDSRAITICNPPYGERMLEIKQAEELYRIMGEKFPYSRENPCYIISPDEEFEKFYGRKADKRRKLYNGMIKCQLFMYRK
ncbi:MAG: class I SAM-dependent RNA methyltransferase [Oscillospiraceae bacterium]